MATDLVSFPLTDTRCWGSLQAFSGTSATILPHEGRATAFPRMLHPKDVTALPVGVGLPSELAGEWVIARVRGGFERKLVLLLATVAEGIGYCLPMEHIQRRSGGQNRGTYTRLIFPSYLFVCCRHQDDFYELVARDGVFERIAVKDQSKLARELDGFHIAAENGLLNRDNSGVRKGVKCEIIRGPMRGHQGYIDEVKGEDKRRVVIAITILGAERATDIPIEDVEPVN